jgi:intracellular sulfur oxidation DsrE/DsrF family protein
MSKILSIATGAAFAVLVTTAYAQDKAALSGLKELKIAFDVTTGNSDALVRELDVIDETRESLMKQGIKPSIVIGFRSGATKLVQTDQSKIKPEDRANADKIAAKIKALHTAEGIAGIEQCSIAARLSDTNPEAVDPGITVVGNGWISLAAYQAKGYTYISAD